MRVVTILTIGLALLLCAITPQQVRAEKATQEEMELVCQNWLSYMVYQKGAWAGEARPQIVDVDEIVEGDTILARCFSIAPNGFVVVPILKELPPIKAYSEEGVLDVNQTGGIPQLLRDVLLHRTRLYVKMYGSLDAVQPKAGDVLLGREHKAEWSRFLKSQQEFKADLTQGKFQPLTEVGPLLTTAWHQRAPYNNSCPQGDLSCTDCCPQIPDRVCDPTFPTLVGCVATAAAQIMKYWNWPPSGTDNHSYWWDGDDSCDGPVGEGWLTADFSDSYDWQNMPDNCESGCSQVEQDALAELCYEVGVAFEMDYGVCGSGTWTWMAVDVFPDYFRYDPSIDKEDRADYETPDDWFSIIQTEINNARPMQYRIFRHSIVCDGWRDTGGQNQYHMNYGWGGNSTTWYTIDHLYCYWVEGDICPPDVEYLIRYIQPETGAGIVVRPDGTGDYSTIQAAINAAPPGAEIVLTNGTFTGDGNRDIDFLGKAITVRSQSNNPDLCIIDCQGSEGDPHRGFYFHSGEGSGSVVEGITITNGRASQGGGMSCVYSSPTLTNCTFSGNGSGGGSGGAIFCWGSSPTLTNCTFSGNSGMGGGGMCCGYSSPTLTNCTFSGNGSGGDGGGMLCISSSPILINCTFSYNLAWFSSGGGMGCFSSSPTLINCTFSGNSAPAGGGAIRCLYGSSVTLENTIITFSTEGEAVYCDETSSATLTCCDIYGNAGGDYVGCIADQAGINGNFSEDPLFCAPDNGDFHLLDNSPCAPAQQPSCGLIGALGVGCDQEPPVTMPIDETGVDIPFASGSDTLAILNFVSEDLDYVTIEAENGTLPPDIPESTNWVHKYYSITPIPDDASFEATMTLFYSQTELDVSGLSDESELGLCRYDDSDSTWSFEGGIVDTEENSITLSGVTQFSVWGITDSSNTYPKIRGDTNRDGVIDLGDVVYLINYVYREGPAPDPLWTGDCNCDEIVELGDVVYLINYLYREGPPPGC